MGTIPVLKPKEVAYIPEKPVFRKFGKKVLINSTVILMEEEQQSHFIPEGIYHRSC